MAHDYKSVIKGLGLITIEGLGQGVSVIMFRVRLRFRVRV